MKALILAAGEGTRLGPLTRDCPKPMLPVGGAPMLEHLVYLAVQHGASEIAINLHYKAHTIVDHFGDGGRFGAHITYSFEPELLGSAGAARQLQWFLDERFFLLYGDVLTDLDLTVLAERHVATGAVASLALYEVEDPSRCGMVLIDSDGLVRSFIEKPSRRESCGLLANAGVYVVDPTILQYIPCDRAYDFGHDLFPDLLRRGLPMYAFPTSAYVLDIGAPERYVQAQTDFESGRYRPTHTPALLNGGS